MEQMALLDRGSIRRLLPLSFADLPKFGSIGLYQSMEYMNKKHFHDMAQKVVSFIPYLRRFDADV